MRSSLNAFSLVRAVSLCPFWAEEKNNMRRLRALMQQFFSSCISGVDQMCEIPGAKSFLFPFGRLEKGSRNCLSSLRSRRAQSARGSERENHDANDCDLIFTRFSHSTQRRASIYYSVIVAAIISPSRRRVVPYWKCWRLLLHASFLIDSPFTFYGFFAIIHKNFSCNFHL